MSKKSEFCVIAASKRKQRVEDKVEREARLLRENLKKRKAQARLRTAQAERRINIKMDSD